MGPLASTERSLMNTGSVHLTGYQSNDSTGLPTGFSELLASTERSLMDSRGVPSSVL